MTFPRDYSGSRIVWCLYENLEDEMEYILNKFGDDVQSGSVGKQFQSI